MKLQLLRNATQILTVNDKMILIDPMLAPKDSYEPFMQTGNQLKNPLVDLPISNSELDILLVNVDAVLLTHLHLDHWDKTAQQLLPKDITIFCQPGDAEQISQTGFTNVYPINGDKLWNNISFIRTDGRHGTGEAGKRMGAVSGYIIEYQGESVYLAGDTIWCEEVRKSIDQYRPDRIVVNGGSAKFITGEPIVMNIDDVIKVCNYAENATVYVVHLEAVNHGKESRDEIRMALQQKHLLSRCMVPNDGDYLF